MGTFAPMSTRPTRLYTSQFLLLCASHALFGASFTMIIPELPAYLTSLGGEEFKGLIIALFTLTAGLARPFSGKLTDTIGRVPVMIVGTLVCVVCSALYPVLGSVAGFLTLRFFHGFSTGFKPTASTAYVADMVPMNRRGEALGILSISMNTGASLAPAFGSWLAGVWSINAMFLTSSGVALVSILILLGLQETLENPQPFKRQLLWVKKDEIIHRSAIPPSIVTILVYLGYGAILTIVPDQSTYLGLENKGLFYTVFTATSLLSRLVAGKLSDLYGRVPVLRIAILLLAGSLVLMGWSPSAFWLLFASGCLGFSHGTVAPALFAWTIDRAPDDSRGKAVATMYIALEIGIGVGALASAWLYANNGENFDRAFYTLAALAVLGTVYLTIVRSLKREEQERRALSE
jgi:MFS family permease